MHSISIELARHYSISLHKKESHGIAAHTGNGKLPSPRIDMNVRGVGACAIQHEAPTLRALHFHLHFYKAKHDAPASGQPAYGADNVIR